MKHQYTPPAQINKKYRFNISQLLSSSQYPIYKNMWESLRPIQQWRTSYGSFRLVEFEQQKYVIKSLPKSKRDCSREYQLTQYCYQQHPSGIVKVINCYETGNELNIVLEHCQRKDLAREMSNNKVSNRTRPIQEAFHIIHQLLKSVESLHLRRVVHRDIKPGNILISDDGNYKLSDFGEAKRVKYDQDEYYHTIRGTRGYDSKELRQARAGAGQRPVFINAFKDDVWALGRTFFDLCINDSFLTMNTMLQDELDSTINTYLGNIGYPDSFKRFMSLMLTTDMRMRPNIAQLIQGFETIFLQQPQIEPTTRHFQKVQTQGEIAEQNQVAQESIPQQLQQHLNLLAQSINEHKFNIQIIAQITEIIKQERTLQVQTSMIPGICQHCQQRYHFLYILECDHIISENCIDINTIDHGQTRIFSCPLCQKNQDVNVLFYFNKFSPGFASILEEECKKTFLVRCVKCKTFQDYCISDAQRTLECSKCKNKFCSRCPNTTHTFRKCPNKQQHQWELYKQLYQNVLNQLSLSRKGCQSIQFFINQSGLLNYIEIIYIIKQYTKYSLSREL